MSPIPRRALVFDLDGTLLCPRKVFDPLAADWLRRAGAEWLVVFATARPPRATFPLLGEFAEGNHVVCYNGGMTFRNRTTIAATLIGAEDVCALLTAVLRAHAGVSFGFERDDQLYAYGNFDRHFPREYTVATSFAGMPFGTSPKILVDLPHAGIEASVRAMLPEGCRATATDAGGLLQVMARGVSKKSAAERILAAHGVPWREAICFGDDLNDLELFQVCGRGVAVQNAHPAVLALATDVTETSGECGVGRFLQRALR